MIFMDVMICIATGGDMAHEYTVLWEFTFRWFISFWKTENTTAVLDDFNTKQANPVSVSY